MISSCGLSVCIIADTRDAMSTCGMAAGPVAAGGIVEVPGCGSSGITRSSVLESLALGFTDCFEPLFCAFFCSFEDFESF